MKIAAGVSVELFRPKVPVICTGTVAPRIRGHARGDSITLKGDLDPLHDILAGEIVSGPATDLPIRILDIGIAAAAPTDDQKAITTRQLAHKLLDYPRVEVYGLDVDLAGISALFTEGRDEVFDPPFSQPNLTFIEADATVSLYFGRETVDWVLCFNSLPYFGEAGVRRLFQNVFCVLKPGGQFLFSRRYGCRINFSEKDFVRLMKVSSQVHLSGQWLNELEHTCSLL